MSANGAADSALAAADLLDCFNQSRIIFIAPRGAKKCFCPLLRRPRGRKSSASLSVIPVDGRASRLAPPRYLNRIEKAVFVELASTAGHFVPTDGALLASLAQATVIARRAARDPGK
jgi:hypothetical protein